MATRRYARYQNRWVRKQMFEERNRQVIPPVYSLDSTRKERFDEDVVQPALKLIGQLDQVVFTRNRLLR